MSNKCNSCGAPIIWAVTAKGKRMPVDAMPTPTGTIDLEWDGDVPKATVVGLLPGLQLRYTSHFATCPHAGKWRK